MSLNETPGANRMHIGFFGKRNSGKSSIINAFTGQQVAIVSDVAGTTTDPVYKPMEVYGIGPCVFIDTAGFDDEGDLGKMRIEKTKLAALKTDMAVIVFHDKDIEEELKWFNFFKENNTIVVSIISKADEFENSNELNNLEKLIQEKTKSIPIKVSINDKESIKRFKEELIRNVPEGYDSQSITKKLVNEGDVVMLVMPQDIQAPKGRLILPQVQTIRDLLDNKCIVISCTTDKIDETLNSLKNPPKLIITDSQVFKIVYEKKPKESKLTSFSVLFAEYKGDVEYYRQSAKAIDTLTENSKVLIAECCTHAPLKEDIGREKIPKLLRKKAGEKLTVDIVSGTDFPKDLSNYDLVIQCGACMFNKKYVLTRIERAKRQNVPMSNYGVVIAYLCNILDYIE